MPDRPQDQAVKVSSLLRAQDEEDRQRDPEAVLAHPQRPVDGDPGGERRAEAQRVAEAGRAQGEVRAQGSQGRGRAPGLGLPAPPPRSPAAQTQSEKSAWSRPPAVARSSAGSVSAASSGRPWAISSESATESPAIAKRSETEKQ